MNRTSFRALLCKQTILATQQWIVVEKNTEKKTAIVNEQLGGTDAKNKDLASKCEAGRYHVNR